MWFLGTCSCCSNADAPFYELDTITLGQAELVWAPRLEIMHHQQDRARLRVACSILRHLHSSRRTGWDQSRLALYRNDQCMSVCLSKTVAGRVELLVPRSQWLQLHHHHLSFARQDVATSACGSGRGCRGACRRRCRWCCAIVWSLEVDVPWYDWIGRPFALRNSSRRCILHDS